ncbi:glycosyltransferase family 39 protein [Hydrogenophaga sp.]|uniref:ArnT family glycosyltransferase n=1 Tax=Hydrogenophaga sp. TaxID=1904254 RepID=UPI00271D0267|nr:glycosyltransferase family 39 protein [Hydrogenophaga sp.]MDO8906217.1 glycosyltransferase family 39 protein [Hydrogenophaga sp.]
MTTTTSDASIRRQTLFWLVAMAVVLLAGIGLRFPWPADEPRFAQIAREMVETGQWLFPTRGGEYYPDKPPVFIWLSALFYGLLGNLKLSFLLPSALAAIGTLWLVYDLGRRLWNAQTALLAVLVLAFTPQFLLQGKAAQMDALVAFWITLGCYGLLRHFLTGPHWRWYYVSWVAMGLGIMTKGVGFLPLLMMLPLALWRKDFPCAAPHLPAEGGTAPAGPKSRSPGACWNWRLLLGLPVMLAVIALWLGPMLWQVHNGGTEAMVAYRNDLLFRQTGERFVNAWHHVKPWHYFFTQAIPTVWFPLPVLLLVFWRPLVGLLREDPKLRVLLAWVGLVLLFFSLSSGKREVYILPALPMLSLVVAVLWAQVRERALALKIGTVLQWLLMALAVLIAGLGLAVLLEPQRLPSRLQDHSELLGAVAYPLIGLGLAWLVLLVWLRRADLFVRLAASNLAVWLFVSLLVWPLADPYRTPQRQMEEVEQRLPGSAELGLLYFKEQFLLFAQRPLTHFSYLAPLAEQEKNAWIWMREAPRRFLLVPTGAELSCFDVSRAVSLGRAHRREWVLLGSETLTPVCGSPIKAERFVYRPVTHGVLP